MRIKEKTAVSGGFLIERNEQMRSAIGNGHARKADLFECVSNERPSVQDAIGSVRVRSKGDLSSAEPEVPFQDVPPRQKVAGAPRRGVDFEDLSPCDDPGKDLVEQVGKVGTAQEIVRIGGIARNIADMRNNVVRIGRVQTFAHLFEIGAVRLFARLARKVFPVPRVFSVDRVYAVHHEIGMKARDRLCIERVGARVARVAEFSADEDAHPARIGFLPAARLGKVRFGVDHGHGFSLCEHAVRQIVVVEVFGNAVICRAEFRRAGEHVLQERSAVGGKSAVGMNVCELHTRIIARFSGFCNRQSTRRAVMKYFWRVADICSMTA